MFKQWWLLRWNRLNDGCARKHADVDGDDASRRPVQLRAADGADRRRPRPPHRRRPQPTRTRRVRAGDGRPQPDAADRRRGRRWRPVKTQRQHDRVRNSSQLGTRRRNRRKTRLLIPSSLAVNHAPSPSIIVIKIAVSGLRKNLSIKRFIKLLLLLYSSFKVQKSECNMGRFSDL